MNEQTQKLIAALLSTPELVQSVRRDPFGFAMRVATGAEAAPVVSVIKELAGRLKLTGRSRSPEPAPPSSATLLLPPSSGAVSTPVLSAHGLPVASVVSLGAIMGTVAILSTVCAVAISRDEDSRG